VRPYDEERAMLRRTVGGVLVLVLCAGVALADEIRAVILKVDGDKITFAESKGKGEKGPEQTLPVTPDLKVVQGTYNKDTKKFEDLEAVQDGLKNELLTKISEKGLRATVVTDPDNKKITEIRIRKKK
jgi:hypothetical protein